MPAPSENKTVQARILEYAEAIGWTFVSREEAAVFVSRLRRAKGFSRTSPPSRKSYGGTSREFVEHLRNRGKFFDHEEKRERDLILIDYEHPERNVYEVTEEFTYHNGHYGTREDVVFLINGIPVLVTVNGVGVNGFAFFTWTGRSLEFNLSFCQAVDGILGFQYQPDLWGRFSQ